MEHEIGLGSQNQFSSKSRTRTMHHSNVSKVSLKDTGKYLFNKHLKPTFSWYKTCIFRIEIVVYLKEKTLYNIMNVLKMVYDKYYF